jgi:hypothetical protein
LATRCKSAPEGKTVPGKKTTSQGWRILILPLLLICVAAAGAQGTPGASPTASGWKSESVPLAINIEGKPVRSSLYLQYESKNYGMTLEQYGAQRLDEREKLFFQGMRAIRGADAAVLKSVWQNPAANPKATISFETMDAKTYLEKYAVGYGKFEGLKILSRIELGSESMFVWTAKASNGLPWADGSLIHTSAAKQVFTPVTQGLPVATLIVDSKLASLSAPDSYAPQDVHVKYRNVLNLQGKAGPGPHPVALQFNGTPMNFSVFDNDAKATHPALAYYHDAYMLLKKRSFTEFVNMFLPESRKNVTQWTERLGADDTRAYFDALTSSRYVKFLLDADPVYLVFYSSDPSDKWTASSLHHDYVVRDPQSGSFKLANLLFISSLDDLLNDNDLFSTQMFRRGDAAVAPQTKGSK